MLRPGLSAQVELVVGVEHTARRVGSGGVDVLATPVLITLLEAAAVKAVAGALPPGADTVGTRIDVRHLAATPVGMRVVATAELVAVDGRRLAFRLAAADECEAIGEGTHERATIDAARFIARVRGKLRPALFTVGSVRAVALEEADLPTLQAFYEANPEYFIVSGGEPPGPDEARHAFDDRPPPEFTWSQRWLIGFIADDAGMVAMAEVVSDLLVPGVWHIGLFIVATALHGTGLAARLLEGLEAWCGGQAARWMRLGVICGNERAERFWVRRGYVEVRRREGVSIGGRTHTVRVMVRPLAEGSLERYLELVPRDRP